MNTNKIVSMVVAVVVLALAGYFVFRGGDKTETPPAVVESVATVNGVVIPKTNYETQLANSIATFKTQGVDVENAESLAQIKTQVLDDMINNELVSQGITVAGITASTEEVDKQLKAITDQAGGQEKLLGELAKANLTEAQLRENVTRQVAIQAYLAANVNIAGVTVTDAEVTEFYTEYAKSQKAAGVKTVPTQKELTDQIKQQITLNKQQALVNEFIAALRAKATIVKSI